MKKSDIFSLSPNISEKKVDFNSVSKLPNPIRDYFKNVLKEGQSYISYVELEHSGKFKIGPFWLPITGKEYFTCAKPNFYWEGKVPLFKAVDYYLNGKGTLIVKLFSKFILFEEKGEKMNSAEILRWLAESPWYPTALLPKENLKWEKINDDSAKVTLIDKNIKVEGVFYFNKGKIVKFKAKRYKDNKLREWIGTYRNYKEINGYKIPTRVEVKWRIDREDFKYADFKIENIKFDLI